MFTAACLYFQRRMVLCHPFLFAVFLTFGLAFPAPVSARSEFTATVKAAYADALKLKLESSRQLSAKALGSKPKNLCALLVSNYPDALYLLFTEDQDQYECGERARTGCGLVAGGESHGPVIPEGSSRPNVADR